MTRKFRLLTAAAAMLIAIFAGDWKSPAAEWQSAPAELFTGAHSPTEIPVPLSQAFLESRPFRPIELPVTPLQVRLVSWSAPDMDTEQQSAHHPLGQVRLPPPEMRPAQLNSGPRDALPFASESDARFATEPSLRFATQSNDILLFASDPNLRFAAEPQDTLPLESELNVDFWISDHVSPIGNASTKLAMASAAGPLLISPASSEAELLPPQSMDGEPPGVLNPVYHDGDPGAIPVFVQEFPYANLELPARPPFAARLGWWSVDQSGNPAKVGEYQSLNSSPFFDLDGLFTNGVRTWDFHGSILDNDSSSTGGRYFGPLLSTRWDYERYLRRLDRDPLDAFVDFDQQPARPLPAPPQNFRDMKEDLTVGDDFAIRVQELDAGFQGPLTNHVNWRLNIWGMRKHGERQALAMAHCYTAPNATDTNGNPVTGVACHMLSQSQRIDWLTAEIEPALEGKFGPVTAEYSRTVRTLTTDDQLVTRPYDNFGFTGDQPYNLVPENLTEIDRLKFGFTLPERRSAYARFYNGNTRNEFRDTNRRFHGMDLRVSDRSVDGITVTAYAKTYVQTGQFPSFLLPFENAASIRQPINYDRTTAGIESTWRPFYDEYSLRRHLRLSCGYEYRELDRENALFVGDNVAVDQSSTTTNKIYLRGGMRWSPAWNSYVRYRLAFIDDPLFAIADNDTTNTSLPTQTHRVEFRNTWSPTHTFLLSGLLGVDYDWNSSDVANSQVDNYDLVFTAWYAPTPRWSISGGLAFYRNWIDQDITLGPSSTPLTLPWEYGGRSDVINLGTTFVWTKRMTLSGTLDFVNGENAFDPLVPWPDLPIYSDVKVKTTRFMAGVDYDLGPRTNCYARYQLFDYDDEAASFDSGRAEMLLIGGTAVF